MWRHLTYLTQNAGKYIEIHLERYALNVSVIIYGERSEIQGTVGRFSDCASYTDTIYIAYMSALFLKLKIILKLLRKEHLEIKVQPRPKPLSQRRRDSGTRNGCDLCLRAEWRRGRLRVGWEISEGSQNRHYFLVLPWALSGLPHFSSQTPIN